MAIYASITISRGSAPVIEFLVKRPSATEPENRDKDEVVDVTGYETAFTLRTSEVQADPEVLEKTGTVVSPASAGKIRVTLTRAETLALKARALLDTAHDYVYGFNRTNTGAEDDLANGPFHVKYNIRDPR